MSPAQGLGLFAELLWRGGSPPRSYIPHPDVMEDINKCGPSRCPSCRVWWQMAVLFQATWHYIGESPGICLPSFDHLFWGSAPGGAQVQHDCNRRSSSGDVAAPLSCLKLADRHFLLFPSFSCIADQVPSGCSLSFWEMTSPPIYVCLVSLHFLPPSRMFILGIFCFADNLAHQSHAKHTGCVGSQDWSMLLPVPLGKKTTDFTHSCKPREIIFYGSICRTHNFGGCRT